MIMYQMYDTTDIIGPQSTEHFDVIGMHVQQFKYRSSQTSC
jgi:hypothetical protein